MADHKKTANVVREYVESLAIAFILAMVIRHFVVEAFKIPTKSMEPTLLGDPKTGDKILVNKFMYDIDKPARWDVMVFKFPVEPEKNYIKRLVGLPGEKIQIRNGDVYIEDGVARKPFRIQEELWQPFCDDERLVREELRRIRLARPANAEQRARLLDRGLEGWWVASESCWRISEGALHVDATAAPGVAFARLRRAVDRVGESKWPVSMGDLKISFDFQAHTRSGSLHTLITENSHEFLFTLPLSNGPVAATLSHSGEVKKTSREITLDLSRPHRVEFVNVDDRAWMVVDEQRLLVHDYDSDVTQEQIENPSSDVRIGCTGARLSIRDVQIHRDIYYTSGQRPTDSGLLLFGSPSGPGKRSVDFAYRLEDDEYFVLGDNSARSNDSREWGPVPQENVIGEAFLVFWPVARVKVIR